MGGGKNTRLTANETYTKDCSNACAGAGPTPKNSLQVRQSVHASPAARESQRKFLQFKLRERTLYTATACYLVVEKSVRATAFSEVSKPVSQLFGLLINKTRREKYHLTSTSNQPPVTPMPMPIKMTTSHIRAASNLRQRVNLLRDRGQLRAHHGSRRPRTPCCARWLLVRSRSTASSCSQSIVLPSTYCEAE